MRKFRRVVVILALLATSPNLLGAATARAETDCETLDLFALEESGDPFSCTRRQFTGQRMIVTTIEVARGLLADDTSVHTRVTSEKEYSKPTPAPEPSETPEPEATPAAPDPADYTKFENGQEHKTETAFKHFTDQQDGSNSYYRRVQTYDWGYTNPDDPTDCTSFKHGIRTKRSKKSAPVNGECYLLQFYDLYTEATLTTEHTGQGVSKYIDNDLNKMVTVAEEWSNGQVYETYYFADPQPGSCDNP